MNPELKDNFEGYRQFFAEMKASPGYWKEGAIHEFIHELDGRMRAQGVTRAELARRLGTSKAYVTKVLGGHANFTLETMSRIAFALGGRVRVHIADLHTVTEWRDRPAQEPSKPAKPRARKSRKAPEDGPAPEPRQP